MIPIYIALAILFTHFVADFIFQTQFQAMNKSKSNYALTQHVLTYTTITLLGWGIFLLFAFPIQFLAPKIANICLFISVITSGAHFITDYFTSRWTSKLYKAEKWYVEVKDIPKKGLGFFAVIGLDQTLHFIQLFLMYKLIAYYVYL